MLLISPSFIAVATHAHAARSKADSDGSRIIFVEREEDGRMLMI